MITSKECGQIAEKKLGSSYQLVLLNETDKVILFLGVHINPAAIPNRMFIAVNKSTGKCGMSILDPDQAVGIVGG